MLKDNVLYVGEDIYSNEIYYVYSINGITIKSSISRHAVDDVERTMGIDMYKYLSYSIPKVCNNLDSGNYDLSVIISNMCNINLKIEKVL